MYVWLHAIRRHKQHIPWWCIVIQIKLLSFQIKFTQRDRHTRALFAHHVLQYIIFHSSLHFIHLFYIFLLSSLNILTCFFLYHHSSFLTFFLLLLFSTEMRSNKHIMLHVASIQYGLAASLAVVIVVFYVKIYVTAKCRKLTTTKKLMMNTFTSTHTLRINNNNNKRLDRNRCYSTKQ